MEFMTREDMAALYEQDFVEWTKQNSKLLRRGCFAETDVEHIAEEIEDMGKEQKHSLERQVRRLLVHLLKYEFQPTKRSRSWLVSMASARIEITDLLERNPSLRRLAQRAPAKVYPSAVRLAALETGLARGSFLPDCPYTFDQIMDEDFPLGSNPEN
jgi:Domain of unknown function DUF29